MALVRCPIHGVRYSEENPRGCPACWLEREGAGHAQVMRELARASQTIRRPSRTDSAEPAPTQPERLARESQPLGTPVTPPPRMPVAEPTRWERVAERIRRRPVALIGVPLIAVMLAALVLRSGPRFVAEPSPAPFAGEVLPLPIEPGMPISTVFAILGTRAPQPHPESQILERHAYGSDLAVDALGGVVYAVVLMVPNRSWHGLRVGLDQRQAEGALALLGPPLPGGEPVSARADTLGGWVVYSSLEGRPRRTLKAEVRPPNGCYDVVVDIQPRAAGFVIEGSRRYAAVAPPGALLEWVATRIQVFNRALAGPAGPPAC